MKTKTAVRLTSLCLCICIMLLLAPQVYAAQTEIVSIVTKLTTQTVDRSTGGSLALNSSLVGSDSSGKRYAVKVIWKNDEYRSYKDGTFIFSAEPVDSNYIFSSECIPQVTVINKINGDFDSNVSRKYYFDHTNDFLDFSCYYTENDFSGAAGYYDIRLSQKSISDYWTLNNGKIVSTISRTTENVWNGLNRASCVSSVILNSLKLYNFRLEVDYQHAADWWYPYVLFGVQDPTRFFGKLYISPYGNLTTGDGTDLAFDRSTLAGGVYAYLEQEGVINVYGAVDDDGYGRLYFDKDISADKQVLVTYNRNEKHHMSITVIDGVFGLQIDDSDIFYGNIDDEALGGLVGFAACSKGASFDNFKVTALDESGNEISLSSAPMGNAPALKEDNYTGWDSSKCPLEYVWGDGFDQTKW